MKNSIILSGFLIVLSVFSSCGKKYDCVCTGGISGHLREEVNIKASSKQSAETECKAKSDPVGTADGVYCELD